MNIKDLDSYDDKQSINIEQNLLEITQSESALSNNIPHNSRGHGDSIKLSGMKFIGLTNLYNSRYGFGKCLSVVFIKENDDYRCTRIIIASNTNLHHLAKDFGIGLTYIIKGLQGKVDLDGNRFIRSFSGTEQAFVYQE